MNDETLKEVMRELARRSVARRKLNPDYNKQMQAMAKLPRKKKNPEFKLKD